MISFAVMKLPRGLNAAYERSPVVQQNLAEFRSLRGAFKLIDPGAYRGIERCPLSEVPEQDPGWIHESADRFRSFYVKQSWAETEAVAGEFSVIRFEGTEELQDALV